MRQGEGTMVRPHIAFCAAACVALLTESSTFAVVNSYIDESQYLAAVAAAGYDALVEDFEGAAWDPYRTTNPFDPQAAPTVTSQGITWSGNDQLSTNTNWGRNGSWGVFTIFGGTSTPDTLAGASGQTLYGVGGWVNVNPDGGGDIAILINGQVVADRNIGAGHQFIGVIDTAGFTSFEIVDLEQQTAWGADDFTFAVSPAIAGDLNGDCVVDLTDLAQLLANYGVASGAAYEQGDLDGDGDVDLSDLSALLSAYGTVCP
jgi:hypothetical protein